MGRSRAPKGPKPLKRPKIAQNARAGPGSFDPSKSRIRAVDQWSQEELGDDEDDFFTGKDKVLLEHSGGGGRFEDDLDLPDEILRVKGYSSAEEDEEDYEDLPAEKKKKQRKPKPAPDTAPRGRFAKPASGESPSDSDEEFDSDDDEEVDAADVLEDGVEIADLDSGASHSESGEGSDSEDEAWRSYHVSARSRARRGESPTSGEEAKELERLELEEVQRLRAKARSRLVESDFLIMGGDLPAGELENEEESEEGLNVNEAKKVEEKSFETEAAAIAHLIKTKPEALALVDDFRRGVKTLKRVDEELKEADAAEEGTEGDDARPVMSRAVGWLHYHTLSTYLSTLSFYFHLILKPATPLIDSVTASLAELRETLSTLEDLGLTGEPGDEDLEGLDLLEDMGALDEDELDDLLEDGSDSEGDEVVEWGRSEAKEEKAEKSEKNEKKAKKGKKSKKEKTQLVPPFLDMESQLVSSTTKPTKRKKSRPEKPEPTPPLLSLHTSSTAPAQPTFDDDYLEQPLDSADTKTAKKPLSFYTSKIASKVGRRLAATGGGRGMSGDEDMVYKSREERRREALKRQRHDEPSAGGADYGGEDYDGVGEGGGGGEAEEYYDLVKELKDSGRKAKKAKYDEGKLADRDILTTEADSSGPRTASRQILLNKGLTPKRAKANRNPRVKKRLRYEKAQQKVKSQHAVFKGGKETQMARSGGYEGEKGGIGKTVKSRKL